MAVGIHVRLAFACLALGACTASREPAVAVAPPPPARPLPVVEPAPPSAPTAAVLTAPPPAAAAAIVAPAPATEEPAAPRVRVEIERPFRLDLRVVAKDRAVFLTELRERERWNKGDLGELAAPLPDVPGHPAPKVIIDVTQVRGPHKSADVQRDARRAFWVKVVGCYAEGAYKDQKLRGKTRAVLQVDKNGKVKSVRIVDSTLKDDAVPKCFGDELRKLALPKARAGSAVSLEIQVGPGDEPVQPPTALLAPGDGTIDPEAVRDVVRAALPTFEACYRPALAYAPHLWGRLGIRFHQTDKGKLDEAFEAESRFPDERVTLCVLRAARALSFPKPANGDVRFVVPLRFSTEASP